MQSKLLNLKDLSQAVLGHTCLWMTPGDLANVANSNKTFREPVRKYILHRILKLRHKEIDIALKNGLITEEDFKFFKELDVITDAESAGTGHARYLQRQVVHSPHLRRNPEQKKAEEKAKQERANKIYKYAIFNAIDQFHKAELKDVTWQEFESTTDKQKTPVMLIALEVGCTDVVNHFFRIKVQAEVKDQKDIAIRLEINIQYRRSLKDEIIPLLEAEKAKKDFNYTKWIAIAVTYHNIEALKYLVTQAKKDGKQKQILAKLTTKILSEEMREEIVECTAVHLAALSGSSEALNFLLEEPEAKDILNQKDSRGWTPLHCAASRGHYIAVLILIKINPRAFNLAEGDDEPFRLAMDKKDKRTVYAFMEYRKHVSNLNILTSILESSKSLPFDFRKFLVLKNYSIARFDTLKCLYDVDSSKHLERKAVYDDCIKRDDPIPLTTQRRGRGGEPDNGFTILHDFLSFSRHWTLENAGKVENWLKEAPQLLNIQDDRKDTPLFVFLRTISKHNSEGLERVPDILKALEKFKEQIDFKLVNGAGETLLVCIDRLSEALSNKIVETQNDLDKKDYSKCSWEFERDKAKLPCMKTALARLQETKQRLQPCMAEHKDDGNNASPASLKP